MNRLTTSSLISVVAGVLLAAAPVAAMPVVYGTGFDNPTETIDFTGLLDGTPIDVTYAAEGVTFTGLFATSSFGNSYPPSAPPAAANFLGILTNPTFSIEFAAPVTDADFVLVTDGFGATITSSLNGTTVETESSTQYRNTGADYFGFTGSSFDTLTVNVAGDGVAFIDNLQVGQTPAAPVPEPASGAMMLAGLAGLMLVGGRRRI